MKKLILMMCVMLIPISGWAEPVPYTIYEESTETITFGYGEFTGNIIQGYPYGTVAATEWKDRWNGDIKKVIFSESCSAYYPTDLSYIFGYYSNLTEIVGLQYLNTSKVTNMCGMFDGCSKLTNIDLSHFNTENVTKMGAMFNNCSSLTSLDVSKFNSSKVTEMYMMFSNCSSLTNIDVSNFNTNNVTDMSALFQGCKSLISLDLSNFNTEKVTNMRGMFSGCSGLTSLDIRNFDTSYVTDLSYMFYGCSDLSSLDVSKFNTAKVTDMNGMFIDCKSLTSLNVSSFNTSNVTDMHAMFSGCESLAELNVSNFNTGNVTDMSHMLNECSKLASLDITNFNTSNVTNMQGMFMHCKSLTKLDIRNFDTSNVTDMYLMFYCCTNLRTIFCNDTWTKGQKDTFDGCVSLVGGDGTPYLNDKVSSDYAHPYNGGYFTIKGDTYSGPYTLMDNTSTLTFMYGELTDETEENYYSQGITDIYYGWNNLNLSACKKATFDVSCREYYPTTMHSLFSGFQDLTEIGGFQNLNTSKVSDMSSLFSGCSSLTNLDVSNFNTSNVTDMKSMFYGCKGLTHLDTSIFNTSKVSEMESMFSDCSGLTNLDVSNFNTGNVTSMRSMFKDCSSLTSLDISKFNTSKVSEMGFMFSDCSGLTNLDVSNFNTGNVTSMRSMFKDCSSLTSLDVSNFNTSRATDLSWMFSGCHDLKTIYCNDTWPTGYSLMFNGCTKIKGGDGTFFSSLNTSSDYAHPNSGGYFTAKRTTFSTVTIGESVQYWSSFYTDTRNVRADNSTTVYTATLSSDGKELTLNEIADKIIPCGQAVLMKSTVKEPMFVTASSEGTGDYSTNSLQGTQVDIPTSSIEGTVYTLANSTEFGFYKYTGETLKGGKAFLVVPGGALARITIAGLGDDATGIEGIGTDESQATCYDLQGRRVSQPQKGIYIINGKKVVK